MDEFSFDEIAEMRTAFENEDPDTPLSEASELAQSFACAVMDSDMYLGEAAHEEMLTKTIGELAPYVKEHFDANMYMDDDDDPFGLEEDPDFWDSFDPM